MTRETKIKLALDKRDEAIKDLKEIYSIKFGTLRINSAGETSASELLELNAWFVQAQNKIDNEFIKDIEED